MSREESIEWVGKQIRASKIQRSSPVTSWGICVSVNGVYDYVDAVFYGNQGRGVRQRSPTAFSFCNEGRG